MQDTYTIKEVNKLEDNYDISTNEGGCFYISTKYLVEPKVGDEVTLHFYGGSTIRGVDLNGETVYYKSDEQLAEESEEWLAKYKREKEEKFLAEKDKLDASFDKLPQCFKDRITKFRENNPDFRIDYEGYEMFCCEQAIVIAEACKTPEEVQAFKEKSWEDQKAQITELSDDHSGNTFGAACTLAFWYLKEESNIKEINGALAPLVGSVEYGDVPKV